MLTRYLLYNTLYTCLVTLTKLLAPFMPFLAERYTRTWSVSAFPTAPESVHLADFQWQIPVKSIENYPQPPSWRSGRQFWAAGEKQCGHQVRQPAGESCGGSQVQV